ncbi:MAG TPA: DUF5681 domain-containing protein [Xanthobacteraceae bacterium]|nr:DUF5681 domain-containing protein [Xanthobacteraceae bacterium]
MTFLPGRSGNPAGRPRGSRNKRTILAEQILHDRAADVTQAAVDLAVRGNGPALRMCLDRIAPPMRHRLLDFDLPSLRTADDAVVAADLILQGAAHGELTVQEAAVMMKLVRTFTLVLAAAERARKHARIEAPYAEDLAYASSRDAARHDGIGEDQSIAAQGARQGTVGAAKADESPRPATQEPIEETLEATAEKTNQPTTRAAEETLTRSTTAAGGAPQLCASAHATVPRAAHTSLDRVDVDEAFANLLAETVARVRPTDVRGMARPRPRETGDRSAAAA